MAHSPFTLLNQAGAAAIVIICDHASNLVPPHLNDLGLGRHELQQHIAWDIGAAGIARILADDLDSPAVLCGTSRLVIDCNRHPHDPKAMPAVSDGIIVPGNQILDAAARQARVDAYFTPYHDAIEAVIGARLQAGQRPLILSVHSMTAQMAGGTFRPWQIALSSNEARDATDRMLAILRRNAGITVGDNQPYNMDPAEDYSTPVHALARNLPYLQVEFRQDEVADDAGIKRWAALFGAAMREFQGSAAF
ncbi:putative N-formylglutamate amidohydrolase [Dongia mobilis]|uniref:Putative N-formylglutamate amidohydrolase n=1 Tax=Dongia mobilis TaxID=578943 RepID=A0A4R6WUM2_9PROT|nr:N-formylglutamate amidohydrolase [Dongia mobilis]TDQ83840.1 putative N-formylglutamate amidohydrolase [Dongia mobilis]